jgi:hypothetical protein
MARSQQIDDVLDTLRRHGLEVRETETGRTTTVSWQGEPYAYVKPQVRSRGVLGFNLKPLRLSGLRGQQFPVDRLTDVIRRFCELYGCDASDVTDYRQGGSNRGKALLIIMNPDVAVRAVLDASCVKPYVRTNAAGTLEPTRRASPPDKVALHEPTPEPPGASDAGLQPLEVVADVVAILNDQNTNPTEKEALVSARLGQGGFRRDVLKQWQQRCSVTGSSTLEAIRASHIKPWRVSEPHERIDPNNGLPLVANLDALFDAGLISFDLSGTLVVSPQLDSAERQRFGLTGQSLRLRKSPAAASADYLLFHRDNVFRK